MQAGLRFSYSLNKGFELFIRGWSGCGCSNYEFLL